MDYEDQLDRALEETPDIEGSGSRFSLPDPEVRQEGNVTVYENFQSTLDVLDREDTHLMKDRKSTRLNSSHIQKSRMPSSA